MTRHTQLRIIDNCVGFLEQAVDLVQRIDDGVFAATSPLSPRGSIGGHLRHVVDFFQSFLNGLERGQINYNLRQRDPRFEHDRVYAVWRLNEMIAALKAVPLAAGERTLLVNTEDAPADAPADAPDWSTSSVQRELDTLQSHTVHHYAIVAMLLRLHEIDPGPEFGVAPSTIRFWNEPAVFAG
ncbi:MAG: hypothetical protein ABIP75_12460 [Pyrinomonadaceae bacterium]